MVNFFLKTCAVKLFLISAVLAAYHAGSATSELRQRSSNNGNNITERGAMAKSDSHVLAEQGPKEEEEKASIKKGRSVSLLAGPAGDSESNNTTMNPSNVPRLEREERILTTSEVLSNSGSNGICSYSDYSVVAGGYLNFIYCSTFDPNDLTDSYTFLGGGGFNRIVTSQFAVVTGGRKNDITGSGHSFVGGGQNNTVTDCEHCVVSGGGNNSISHDSDYCTVSGGNSNDITSSQYATVVGGELNKIQNNSRTSFIGGGSLNEITDRSEYSVVSGGRVNEIKSDSDYSVIGGGVDNRISDASSATIGGGQENVAGFQATVPGGFRNEATGDYSFSAGSQAHASHEHSAVVGLVSTRDVCESKAANSMHVCAPNGVYITTIATPEGLELGATIRALEDRIDALEQRLDILEQTASATTSPTSSPSKVPTHTPTKAPTDQPTKAPTDQPTKAPTDQPTKAPTKQPTKAPTDQPTMVPTDQPTKAPTDQPTMAPTDQPTKAPTDQPTKAPTDQPTNAPTDQPTKSPTDHPTMAPTDQPTNAPTDQPTNSPTDQPTQSPTDHPTTDQPTKAPTDQPTKAPTNQPTKAPNTPAYSCPEAFVWDDEFCDGFGNWVDMDGTSNGVRTRVDSSKTCISGENRGVEIQPSSGSGFTQGTYPMGLPATCDSCAVQIKGNNKKMRTMEIPMGGCVNSIEVYMEFYIESFESGDEFYFDFTDDRGRGWDSKTRLTFSNFQTNNEAYKSSIVIDTTSLNGDTLWMRFLVNTGQTGDKLHVGRVIVEGKA